MGEELLVGAALGALLGEFLKRVMNLMEKTVHFTPELQVLKSQIEFLQILMDQVNELGEDFKLLYSDQALKILIHKGKQLIKECNDAVVRSTLSRYRKIPCYTKKFRRLDAELKRAESNLRFELCVQQIKKLPALNDGRNGRIRDPAKLIVTKILDKILSGESGRNNNKYNIKLPLLFYHDQRLKGKLYISLLIIIIASSSNVFLIIY